MAAELVALKVDVLVSLGVTAAPYLKNATTRIPIVFALISDPVVSNLVASIPKPGGNATGLMLFGAELGEIRLQFLKEAIPDLSRVGLLFNPNTQLVGSYIEESQVAAAKLGLTLQAFEARSLAELEPAFDKMSKAGMQAVTFAPEGMLFVGRAILAKSAIAHRLPTCVWSRETFEPGALMSYGPDELAIVRRTAVYVDKILKGTKPADLPVEQPTKFELLINLKIAKALGLTLPPTLLARADEVIE
jgi:putative tryptophan/tyrosine transport system substrate-binding protein